MAMEGERNNFCGGFKVEGNRVKIQRPLVSRTFDELSHYDVWGLQECMRCGSCKFSCPFWLVTKEYSDIPSWRTFEVNKIYSMYYTGYGMALRFLRIRKVKSSEFMRWRESAYNCTSCGACTETSPFEIPNWYTALLLRRVLHLTGFNLPEAEVWAENTRKTGNAMGIPKEKWVETANANGMPVDKNAEVLYVPSALEVENGYVKDVPAIMNVMKESWTVSSSVDDVGYYSYFAGDFETARGQFSKIYEEAKRLGVKRIVTTDGTAYFFLRWEAPKSLGYKLDFKVEHLTETVYNAQKQGKVKVENADFKEEMTVHDSEFLGRMSRVEKPPREVLKMAIPDFREPKPSPASYSLFTCGHHLELLKEKQEIVKKVRAYSTNQLANWAKTVVTLDPNCKLSMDNAIRDSQAIQKSYYYTEILSKAIKS